MKILNSILALLGFLTIALGAATPRASDIQFSNADSSLPKCTNYWEKCMAADALGRDDAIYICKVGVWIRYRDCLSHERCTVTPIDPCVFTAPQDEKPTASPAPRQSSQSNPAPNHAIQEDNNLVEPEAKEKVLEPRSPQRKDDAFCEFCKNHFARCFDLCGHNGDCFMSCNELTCTARPLLGTTCRDGCQWPDCKAQQVEAEQVERHEPEKRQFDPFCQLCIANEENCNRGCGANKSCPRNCHMGSCRETFGYPINCKTRCKWKDC